MRFTSTSSLTRALEPARLVGDDREVLPPRLVVDRTRLQQRRIAEDARERCAHLVGDDADQLGTQPLRLPELTVLVFQLLLAPLERGGHLVEGRGEVVHLRRASFRKTHRRGRLLQRVSPPPTRDAPDGRRRGRARRRTAGRGAPTLRARRGRRGWPGSPGWWPTRPERTRDRSRSSAPASPAVGAPRAGRPSARTSPERAAAGLNWAMPTMRHGVVLLILADGPDRLARAAPVLAARRGPRERGHRRGRSARTSATRAGTSGRRC